LIRRSTNFKITRNFWLVLLLCSIGIFFIIKGIDAYIHPSVKVQWTTATEVDVLGFNLMRSEYPSNVGIVQVNKDLILAKGSSIEGAHYQFVDNEVSAGKSYTYLLQELSYTLEITDLEKINVEINQKGFPAILAGLAFMIGSFIVPNMNRQKT